MISPISPLDVTGLFRAAATGAGNLASDFASLFQSDTVVEENAGGGDPRPVAERLREKFQELLKRLGIQEKQTLGLEVDASGDVWVGEEAGEKRAELESAIAGDEELKGLFGEWADAYGGPSRAVRFQWPQRVDDVGMDGAY